MKIIYNGKDEIRPCFCEEQVRDMLIVSYGECNLDCVYCKRKGCSDTAIPGSIEMSTEEVCDMIHRGIGSGKIIRFSGGEPTVWPDLSAFMLYTRRLGATVSIATNGLQISETLMEAINSTCSLVALDCKSTDPERYFAITGHREMPDIETLLSEGFKCAVDVRSVVFADTTAEQLAETGNIIRRVSEKRRKEGCGEIFWTLRKYSAIKDSPFAEPSAEAFSDVCRKTAERFPDLNIGCRNKWIASGFDILTGHRLTID